MKIDVSKLSYEVIARVLGETRAEALAIARVGERILLECETTQTRRGNDLLIFS